MNKTATRQLMHYTPVTINDKKKTETLQYRNKEGSHAANALPASLHQSCRLTLQECISMTFSSSSSSLKPSPLKLTSRLRRQVVKQMRMSCKRPVPRLDNKSLQRVNNTAAAEVLEHGFSVCLNLLHQTRHPVSGRRNAQNGDLR